MFDVRVLGFLGASSGQQRVQCGAGTRPGLRCACWCSQLLRAAPARWVRVGGGAGEVSAVTQVRESGWLGGARGGEAWFKPRSVLCRADSVG